MAGHDAEEQGGRVELVESYRHLAAEKLLTLSSGNISIRRGEHVLITPTGADASIVPKDLVLIDFAGKSIDGGVPSSEWAMHTAIYRARPEAHALVHAHGDACTALACHRRPLPAFHYMVAAFGGSDVPCTDYAPFGSHALAQLAAAALQTRNACLLANHGMICFGPDLRTAVNRALKLEMLARQYMLSLQLGPPHLLDGAEMGEVARRYGFYGVSYIPDA